MELNVSQIALPIASVSDHASLSKAILNTRKKKMTGQDLPNHAVQCQLIPKDGKQLKNGECTPLGERAECVLCFCCAPFVHKLYWLFDITNLNHVGKTGYLI